MITSTKRHFAIPKRGHLIAVEAAIGAAAVAVVMPGTARIAAAALALLLLVCSMFLLKPPAVRRPAVGTPGLGGGALAQLLPRAGLAECAIQSGPLVGVLTDGQGFAAVLEIDHAALPKLTMSDLVGQLKNDPAEPIGLQVIVEEPAKRLLLAIRHEPLFAPDAVRVRSGGVVGARRAVTAAAMRLHGFIAGQGIRVAIQSPAAVHEILRRDGAPEGQERADAWLTPAGAHCVLAFEPRSQQEWLRLLRSAAASPAERSIVSISVDLNLTVRGAIRLVVREHARAAAARAGLLADDAVAPLSGTQALGVQLTLPFGGAPKDLAEAL